MLVNLAQLHHQAGDLARARIDLDEAERRLARAGQRFYECFTVIARAWLSIEEGELRGAEGDLARARELLAAMGADARLEGLVLATEGAVLALRDRPDEAARALRDADAVLAAAGDRGCLDALHALGGLLDLARARAAGREDVAAVHEADARARLDALQARDAAGEVLLSETRVPMRLLARALTAHVSGGVRRLEVASDAGWLRIDGATHDLSRRRALRRLFAGLVTRRLAEPGRALSLDEVIELAWPGERMSALSASRRVYVSIHTLRRLGLEGVLVTREDGYLLDPEIPLVRVG
ncbi:MAG: hypothetical protein M5U28_01840 [Sandaracinaceae bacterium]|nr:hypothetical protein [Sandaracinaceae bacterium]